MPHSGAYSDGYYAGLVNDRNNPHPLFSIASLAWSLGNAAGVIVHCELVEAVYLSEGSA